MSNDLLVHTYYQRFSPSQSVSQTKLIATKNCLHTNKFRNDCLVLSAEFYKVKT